MDGLKQVMAVKSRVVLPYLVPKVKLETNFKLQSCAFSSACCQFSLDCYAKRKSIVWNFLPILCSKYCHLGCHVFIFRHFSWCGWSEIPSEKTFCLSHIFGLFSSLADYSPSEHPCAGFPLVGGRGRSDTALGCHPACYDVCAEREAGDQRRAVGK